MVVAKGKGVPEAPPGRYGLFSLDGTEGRIVSCLQCSEEIKENQAIYIDPSMGKDNGDYVIVVSYWHASCWEAASEK